MVYFYRVVFLALALFSTQASALVPELTYWWSFGSLSGRAGSFNSACSAGVAGVQSLQPNCMSGNTACTWVSSTTDGQCNAIRNGNTAYAISISSTLSCPENSTPAAGNTCVCNAGYVDNGVSCAKDDDRRKCWNFSVLESQAGGALTQDYRLTGAVADGAMFCMPNSNMSPGKGCKVQFDKSSQLDYGGGDSVSEGGFSMSSESNTVDQSCTVGESIEEIPPEEKCKTGYSGTVNGVDTCVNKVPDSGVDGGKKDTSTNDGTNTTNTTKNSSTECAKGMCTTTTTTTTTTTNNATGDATTDTKTTTTTEPKGGFCKDNADSKLCKDGTEGSSFSGSCTAGFKCEGDAIQCAIAQEQHKRACQLWDKETPEYKLYEREKDKEGSVTGDLEGNRDEDISTHINATDVFMSVSASCPADQKIPLANGHSVTIPFSSLCPYLSMLGNIIVIIASISAVRIITRRD